MNVRTLDNAAFAPGAMTPPMTPPALWLPLCSMWLLALLTFSFPGREGPTSLGHLDPLALAKVGARVVVLLACAWAIARTWRHPRFATIARTIVPVLLFLGWSILSAAWSPLKAVSAGQLGGFTVQLAMAVLIGCAAADPHDSLRVITQMNALLLAIASVLVAVHIVSPETSGLARHLWDEGSIGLVHPTSAGATASLGAVILLLTRLIWNPRWTTWLMAPGLSIYALLLLFAASRTSIAMTAVVFAIAIPALMPRRWLPAVLVAFSSMGAVYLCADPALGLVESSRDSATQYLSRGATSEQLNSFSGRTELWTAVWSEFCRSPLYGCGYFITSGSGLLDVWSGPSLRTAHNALLQVLVSTGLIGFGLFVWAAVRIVRRTARDLFLTEQNRRIGVFLALLACWYAGWAQLCSSFMGPIQPESVVFFCGLGLALAGLRTSRGSERDADSAPVYPLTRLGASS